MEQTFHERNFTKFWVKFGCSRGCSLNPRTGNIPENANRKFWASGKVPFVPRTLASYEVKRPFKFPKLSLVTQPWTEITSTPGGRQSFSPIKKQYPGSWPMKRLLVTMFPWTNGTEVGKYLEEQGWHSGESGCLPPMCPRFDSQTRCHVGWVCCWFSTLLLLKNQHFKIPIRSWNARPLLNKFSELLGALWVNKFTLFLPLLSSCRAFGRCSLRESFY